MPTSTETIATSTDRENVEKLRTDLLNRRNSLWLQVEGGGSFYDARREAVVGRFSPGVKFGHRYNNWGIFANLEFDRSFDFTQETRTLDIVHVGLGVEYLQFLGHVRSSISVGLAVLATSTDIDPSGQTGYYVDARPASLRWAVGQTNTLEMTPLALDVSVPVTRGIPMILFSYFSVITFEWAHL